MHLQIEEDARMARVLVADGLANVSSTLATQVEALLKRAAQFAGTAPAEVIMLPLAELTELLAPFELGLLLPGKLARASRKRQLEWLGGRLCAESALTRIDGRASAVSMGDGGEPIWPPGITGSITHNDLAAHAVAVRQSNSCASIGIDSEVVLGVRAAADVATVCCIARERVLWLDCSDRALRTTAIFAAKEALYKAIWPTVRRFVDFDEAEVVAWERDGSRLTLQLADTLAPGGLCLTARLHVFGGLINACVTLKPTDLTTLRPTQKSPGA